MGSRKARILVGVIVILGVGTVITLIGRHTLSQQLMQTYSQHTNIMKIDSKIKHINDNKLVLCFYDLDGKQLQLSFRNNNNRFPRGDKELVAYIEGGQKIAPFMINSTHFCRKYTSYIYNIPKLPREVYIYCEGEMLLLWKD